MRTAKTNSLAVRALLGCSVILFGTPTVEAANRAELKVSGYMPVLCKLDFSTATVQPTAAGRVDLGSVREFCNTNNYRIMVDFDPQALSGSRLDLGADGVELGNSGTDVVTIGTQPTLRTRPISVTLNQRLQAVTVISVRIEAAI